MSHLFSCLLMLISCHVCSAAFRRALPFKLACSFPPLHSHALMRALAFTLHLPSLLSPARMVSSRAISVVPPHLVPLVLVVAIVPVTTLFHPSISSLSPPLPLHPAGLPACPFLYLLHLPSSLRLLTSSSSYLLFPSASSPLLPASAPPPPTYLCSTPVSRQLCRMFGEVSIGSCYRGTE